MIAIDPGLTGGICIDGKTMLMPSMKILTKRARYVFKHKDKKIIIKSGPNKGDRPLIIKSKAKYKNELDIKTINSLFKKQKNNVCYIEELGITRGNSAKVTRTTQINYGKLIALLEIYDIRIEKVTAASWKKYFNLSKEKTEAVELAEKLSGENFRTKKMALLDGPAESYLIYKYGEENEKF